MNQATLATSSPRSIRRDKGRTHPQPMTGAMKVSVVTVCYNSVDTIEDTIRSVLSQQYDRLEYIIVDGGSTDGTMDIVAKYRDGIAKCISERDQGIYDAMNKGVSLAEGELVGFLNADDVYSDSKVISDVAAVAQASHADGVYGDLMYIGRRNMQRIVRYWRAGQYRPKAFFSGWVPPHPTFFCRTALYREFGGFNPEFRVAGDFELMLRFIEKQQISVQYIPKPFVRMRVGGKANTIRGIIQGNHEIIHAFHSNGLAFPLQFFCLRLLRRVPQILRKSAEHLRVPEQPSYMYE
jgi:glycosyltransferase involved in cell wall biosynthesis